MLTAFGVLAKLKGLRGTAFDPFGRTEERRIERALIGEYRAVDRGGAARRSAPANLALAIEIARIPEEIRGYGHVKERHLAAARPKWDALMAEWRAGPLRALGAGARLATAQGPDTVPLEESTLPKAAPPGSQRSP